MEGTIFMNLTPNGSSENFHKSPDQIFEYIVHTYVYRIIYALGFLGNIISLIVWIHTKNRAPPICFFIAICVADTLVLITHSIEKHSIYVDVVCQMLHIFFFAVQIFAIFLVVGMSVEQYLSICRPLKDYKITYGKIWKVICSLALLALMASSLEGYFWALDDERQICTLRKEVDPVYSFVYGYAVLVLLFILPVIIIIVMNALVWNAVKITRQKSLAYGRSMRKAKTHFNKTFHFVSLHLAVGELLYALIHISKYGHYVQGHKTDSLQGRWPSYYITSLPFLVADIVSMSSYALDITFFTLSSRTFRRAALHVFGIKKMTRKQTRCENETDQAWVEISRRAGES